MTASSTSRSVNTTSSRLQALQQHLGQQGWSAVFIPSSDPHLSEYLPAHWQGREWFSGFTGSSGSLLVAAQKAALFTDSRYWEQAEKELAGTGIDLVKLDGPAMPAYAAWLTEVDKSGVLAVDGDVLGLAQAKLLGETLQKMSWQLQAGTDPLMGCWPDRPGLPSAKIFEHSLPYADTSRAEKLKQLRQAMQQQGASHHCISTLDDIAWLLNLRGADVDYNPVFLAHVLVAPNGVKLFIQPDKVPAAVMAALQQDGVAIEAYEQAGACVAALPDQATLLLDPKRVTWGLRERVPANVKVIEAINPTTLAKSRKTEAEARFIREAMAQDGAAMAHFYAWFEQALGHEDISELTVDERLTQARAARPGYVSLSFPTIAGYNANGALPHYRATPESFAMISTRAGLVGSGLLLIDSGAQYLGGTTDITRVWAIGTPSDAQKRDFTLVLKGTMALSRARFPQGTLSPMLDALARAPLWEHGIDFGHGTGHGVGYFLNVHEGPQSISKAIPEPHMAMHAGMITSIEPGLYRPGKWGIRIENLVLNTALPRAANAQVGDPEFGEYLAFETLSLCPIDTRCLDLSLLRPDEIAWLNAYHAEVWQRVSPLLDGDALNWLKVRTTAI